MALDRAGVTNCIRDTLQADTTTLYGSGKLVQTITSNPVLFEKASVDRNKPYKMYLWADARSEDVVRMQNEDTLYTVSFRIEGLNANVSYAMGVIDDIDFQVQKLVNEQMYKGQMFTAYYTDANAQVIDATYDSSNMDISAENGLITAECEGAITVTVNRWT